MERSSEPRRKHVVDIPSPSDLIAAVPHLLSFVPHNSLVVLFRSDLGTSVVRTDIPPDEHVADVVRAVFERILLVGATSAYGVVISDVPTGSYEPPHRLLAEAVLRAAETLTVQVHDVVWVPSITAGARWRCYDDDPCTGVLPDPKASVLAAVHAAAGVVTFASRDEMAASITAAPTEVLVHRANLIRDQAAAPSATIDASGLAVDTAVADAQAGHLPTVDTEFVQLADAIQLGAGFDRVLYWCLEDPVTMQNLLVRLVRGLPAPHRSAAAVALAVSVFLDGNGAYATIALQAAVSADPSDRLAPLLMAAIDQGVNPVELRAILAQVVDLPPVGEIPEGGAP